MGINESNGMNGRKNELKNPNIRSSLNTQKSLILVNEMEHMSDLPLPLSHACKFSNNLYWSCAQNNWKRLFTTLISTLRRLNLNSKRQHRVLSHTNEWKISSFLGLVCRICCVPKLVITCMDIFLIFINMFLDYLSFFWDELSIGHLTQLAINLWYWELDQSPRSK